jgi:pimeloyl-ACP methyl ester carboxylesterase
VLDLLTELPPTFASRAEFEEALTTGGLSSELVAWLAMNLVRQSDDTYRFGLDLAAIRALLDDYFALDLWPLVEAPPGRVRIELVIGGASTVWSEDDRARARRAETALPHRVGVHIVPGAGHWVHVEAPDVLLDLFAREA